VIVRAVAAFGFALGWLPLFLFRVEATRAALPFYTRAERFWVRLSPIILTVHISTACSVLSFGSELNSRRLVLGSVIFGAGLAFWFWGRLLIGPTQVRRLPQEPPRQFRQDGAFGLVRHPLYFSVLVMALAPVVATGSVVLLTTFSPCAIAIAVRATQEERRLRLQVGAAYDDYSRRVKRLVPFVW
jgi:protein-S-isoprenylcysteine O-methyltransferase Ste14